MFAYQYGVAVEAFGFVGMAIANLAVFRLHGAGRKGALNYVSDGIDAAHCRPCSIDPPFMVRQACAGQATA
jgi:hypothetical protein